MNVRVSVISMARVERGLGKVLVKVFSLAETLALRVSCAFVTLRFGLNSVLNELDKLVAPRVRNKKWGREKFGLNFSGA